MEGIKHYLEGRIIESQGESDRDPAFNELTVQQRNSVDIHSN